MAPPVLQESSIMPLNTLEEEEVELEEEKDLLCKCKRHKFAGSIVQLQQEIEFATIVNEKKGPGDPSLEVSAYVLQSNGEANGRSDGHVRDSTSKKPEARSTLNKLCSAIGWKYPTYDFEEQGPPDTKLCIICKLAPSHIVALGCLALIVLLAVTLILINKFTCKVTVHVDTITDTVVECFSDPKPLMKAAQEQAAQGVLWCLKCLRHVK